MESIYTELALYGSKNECARTDNAFSPIFEICVVRFPFVVLIPLGLKNGNLLLLAAKCKTSVQKCKLNFSLGKYNSFAIKQFQGRKHQQAIKGTTLCYFCLNLIEKVCFAVKTRLWGQTINIISIRANANRSFEPCISNV